MVDEPRTEANDARRRAERFGVLPARVRPADVVEMVETEPARGRPESAVSEEQWQVMHAGG